MGIENVQKVVGFGISLAEAIVAASGQATAVGRAVAMLHLLEDAPVLMGIDYAALRAEVSNLSPEDLDKLNTYLDANFDLPDADKEAKIEAAIGLVIDLAKVVVKALGEFKKP